MSCLTMEGRINPVIEGVLKDSSERYTLQKNSHKLRITAVYDWNKPVKEEVFDTVRIFCAEYKFGFSVREFDTLLEEDHEEILKLPAFHIYYDFVYERTIYLDDILKESILEVIDKYKTKKWTLAWPKIPRFSLKRRVVPVLSGKTDV
jgi:hypothetical protein